MPVTSSSSNNSLLCFTNTSIYPQFFKCFDYPVSSDIFICFTFANLLILPVYIRVIWVGFQRSRLQGSSTQGTTSHSDVFTYHMTAVDSVNFLGTLLFFGAIYTCSQWMKMVGYYFFCLTYPGQTFLHCLTCVDRYVAVVHPVTYRALRLVGGTKIRNISIGCVFLLCIGSVGLTTLYFPRFPAAPFFAIFAVVLFVVIFCSLSVLHVLIRLGLGKVGGEQIDQSKQRAFHTIMAITGALMLRSCGLMACNIIFDLEESTGGNGCVILMSGMWMCVSSNLVLPLLFLHKAGKLLFFCYNLNKARENRELSF